MRNIFLIFKHEIITSLSKRSFWIMAFVFPAVIIAINFGTQVVAKNSVDQSKTIQKDKQHTAGEAPIGFIDQARLIKRMPASLPPGMFQAFPDQAAAQAALETGQVEKYFLIPPDFLETGDVVLVVRDFKPLGEASEGVINYLLSYSLSGDETTASLLLNPLSSLENHALAPQSSHSGSNPLAEFVPFATLFIFFFLLTMSSSFMLQSVSREKENRTAEILLVSLRPRELMMGKVLGLSVVALFQMAVWMSISLLVLNQGKKMLSDLASIQLPPGFIPLALLYFLLGYLLYASLMGAIGALAPTMREAGQFTFLVLLPLMVPVWINSSLIQSPNGAVSIFFSLFPLTSPTSMVTRLAASGVPPWQLAASLLALAVTAYFFVLLAARFFRADTLLSSSAINWQRILHEARK